MPITLDRALSFPDPAFAWRWEIVDFTAPQGAQYPANCLDFVHNVGLPLPFLEQAPQFRAGSRTYYAGTQDVNAFTMQFYEDSKYTMHKWITKWHRLIRDQQTGAYRVAREYKGSMTVALLGLDETPVMFAAVEGMWPTAPSPLDLSYASPERTQLVCEFSVDDVTFLDDQNQLIGVSNSPNTAGPPAP